MMETYHGHVRTPADAIILFEACRLGSLPRVQRRLSEKERQSIKSGSVFVWDEREAGMRRWTDGKSWSASRVSGSFLTYREMEGKRGGNNYAPPLARAGRTPDSTRGSDSDMELGGDEGPDGYRYKPDGLMKQSFSITTSAGNHLHLISYYSRSHPSAQALMQPSNDPNLRHIRPAKGMYPESTVHEQQSIPAVTRTPMPGAPMAQIPQVGGYARGGPPPSYPQLGYPWPASTGPPLSNGYPLHYGPSTLPPPPPPSAYGPPPSMLYPQSIPPPISQPPTTNPSPPTEPNLPRPNITSSHSRTGSGSYPQYLPNPSVPSPRTNPVSLALPAPSSQHPSQNNSPSSTPPMSKIDPRLMNPSPLSQHQTLPAIKGEAGTRTPSPAPKRDFTSTPVSRDTATSSASTIPSIGALMNGAGDAFDARSRSASRSPGGSRRDGPQDIPHEKLGFGEDMRALRVLDRAFKT